MLITVVADYGVGDLAFAEVRQRFAQLMPQAEVTAVPVPAFDTVGAGFCVAQLALTEGPADRIVFANVAPREDEDSPRADNAGEPLAAAHLDSGVWVVGVASGSSLSFLAAAGIPVRAVKAADAGSQFRSRDVFPAAVAALARGDDLLGAELTMPPPPANAVVYTDGYGNLKTSWHEPPAKPGSRVRVQVGPTTTEAIVTDGVFTVPAGAMSFAPGSSGWGEPFYELLLRGGSAAARFGHPRSGTPVRIVP
ncbi:SAM-dependent chlorinase/fluorinase [Actinoplanes sp. LDG1-06]|uniref:SAM-dependent chlorinase/fluorinase n=1 Tax=Paractinoplanes ovalisporus TaxID=2810368 RepID=A0ABS2AU28_9ACTN|nr:SAM-dependent chlorinase/fluorinase [Actinoplanes ovalisporus]MBM2623334.1 SAM-dependent chlorinase/fluorinase [Actinoplanes ovalisporus]